MKVPAASQVLDILTFLARHPGPVPAGRIAAELDLPRSTTYHLLSVLTDHGFAVHLPEEHRYGLGVAAFEVGSAYYHHEPLARVARPLLARLVDSVGFNGHVAALYGREVVYIVEERASGRPPLVTDVGVRLPAHLTASGRAMLACLQPAQVRALFPDRSVFVRRTENGPTSPSTLRTVLSQVRTRGYAVEDSEVTPGFASVATAVRDHRDLPVAGIAITYPSDEEVDEAALVRAVRRTATLLATRIGGTGLKGRL